MPSDMPYAVNLLDKEKIARDIELAKTQSDFIVVCPHWGIEYTNEFNREQEEMANSYDYCVNLCRQIFGTEVRIDGID